MPEVAFDVAELAIGRSRLEMHDGRPILLCRSAAGFHASDGMCPHQLQSLQGARVRGNAVMCPHHGARFELASGKSLSFAVTARPLAMFPARLEGTTLVVALPD